MRCRRALPPPTAREHEHSPSTAVHRATHPQSRLARTRNLASNSYRHAVTHQLYRPQSTRTSRDIYHLLVLSGLPSPFVSPRHPPLLPNIHQYRSALLSHAPRKRLKRFPLLSWKGASAIPLPSPEGPLLLQPSSQSHCDALQGAAPYCLILSLGFPSEQMHHDLQAFHPS